MNQSLSQSKCNFLAYIVVNFPSLSAVSLSPHPQKRTDLVKSEQFQWRNCLENELDYFVSSCN